MSRVSANLLRYIKSPSTYRLPSGFTNTSLCTRIRTHTYKFLSGCKEVENRTSQLVAPRNFTSRLSNKNMDAGAQLSIPSSAVKWPTSSYKICECTKLPSGVKSEVSAASNLLLAYSELKQVFYDITSNKLYKSNGGGNVDNENDDDDDNYRYDDIGTDDDDKGSYNTYDNTDDNDDADDDDNDNDNDDADYDDNYNDNDNDKDSYDNYDDTYDNDDADYDDNDNDDTMTKAVMTTMMIPMTTMTLTMTTRTMTMTMTKPLRQL